MSRAGRPRRRDHPIFARFYERLARSFDVGWEGALRDELCADLGGRILEIGAGTGVNLAHYRGAGLVVACDPEPNMLRHAASRASEATVPVVLVRADAERLPFPDDSFDAVVCSLVLCTIRGQRAALGEIRRVLLPGGVVRIYEHVRASSPGTARLQDLVDRPWGFFAGGCHPNRDTGRVLVEEGFDTRLRAFRPPMFGGWFTPHVIGEARPAHDVHA